MGSETYLVYVYAHMILFLFLLHYLQIFMFEKTFVAGPIHPICNLCNYYINITLCTDHFFIYPPFKNEDDLVIST